MGKLIFPDWDEREKKRSKGRSSQLYLGYGYFLTFYQHGRSELTFDPKLTSIPLGKFRKYTERGFPVYDHEGGT